MKMTTSYKVFRGKRFAPWMILIGCIIFGFGEVLNYQFNAVGVFFDLLGYLFVVYGFYFVHLDYNQSGLSPYSTKGAVFAMLSALASGFVAYLIALGDREFWMLIAQVLAMIAIANTAVMLTLVAVIGYIKHWWHNDRKSLSWTVPLSVFIFWIGIAAAGALLMDSLVPLFQGIGRFCYGIRWWSLALVPLSVFILWLNNKIQYKRWIGAK